MSEPPGDLQPVAQPDGGWQRLDARMLLVGPVRTLWQLLLPALVTLFGIGRATSDMPNWLIPIVLLGPIALGTLPWLTTRYRITESQFEKHSGLLNKQRLVAPLDRVRSVDLEASVLHRVMGLTKVQVGTGVDSTRIVLDSLSHSQAEQLRLTLLAASARRTTGPTTQSATAPGAEQPGAEQPGAEQPDPRQPAAPEVALGGVPTAPFSVPPTTSSPQLLATLDWSWLRFAPFSLTRLAVVLGAIGAFLQLGDNLRLITQDRVGAALHWVIGFAIPVLLVVGSVAALAGWVVLAMAGYALQWWDLRLVREAGTVRMTAGLLATRSTTVEESRIRGVQLSEPLLLRMVKGAELAALATGVGSGGVSKLLPPCPRSVAEQVGQSLLDAGPALRIPVIGHGPRARRRCHVQAQLRGLLLTAVLLAAPLYLNPQWWRWGAAAYALVIVAAVIAAELTFANLGHALTPRHLVSRYGATVRTRVALERQGIIGWVLDQSFFQRRAGLADLRATTAAGAEQVVIRNVPYAVAVALADQATPGMLTPWVGAPSGRHRR